VKTITWSQSQARQKVRGTEKKKKKPHFRQVEIGQMPSHTNEVMWMWMWMVAFRQYLYFLPTHNIPSPNSWIWHQQGSSGAVRVQ